MRSFIIVIDNRRKGIIDVHVGYLHQVAIFLRIIFDQTIKHPSPAKVKSVKVNQFTISPVADFSWLQSKISIRQLG